MREGGREGGSVSIKMIYFRADQSQSSPMSSCRVLFVGGGLSSALAASMALQRLPLLEVTVWEKARGAGGRMATSRAQNINNSSVDLGAQYISASPKYYAANQEIYRDLLDNKIILPADTSRIEGMREDGREEGETRHFIVPDGMSSLVKYLFRQSGAQVQFGRRVAEINERNSSWTVRTVCGLEDNFDVVVVTSPVPQILGLEGDISQIISRDENIKTKLAGVSYSSRFVLGQFYSGRVDVGAPWSCKYITDHPIIRFIAVDNIKRNKPEDPTSILVHSTVQFGLENINKTHEEMKPILQEALHHLLPSLPPAEEVKSLKWLYSQVHRPYPGQPGAIALPAQPNLILAGDGFTWSNFDGCVQSARAVVELLSQYLE